MENKIDLNNVQVAFKYKSNSDLKKAIFIYNLLQKPLIVKSLTKLTNLVLKYKLPFKYFIRKTVFEIFCAGENRKKARLTMNHLKQHHVHTVLDYVAEGDKSDISYERNLETILENIQFVSQENKESFVGVKLSGLEDVDFIESVKMESISSDLAKQKRIADFIYKVDEICQLALEKGVKVYFDAEERRTQDVYDFIVEKMMVKYNVDSVFVYNTLQMYMKDRITYLRNIIENAKETNTKLGVKLVRGAYVEKEREYAKLKGIESPVFENKEYTDKAFNEAVEICLIEHEIVNTCLATHNQLSVEKAIDLIQKLKIEDHYNKVYFSQLFGMSDNLTFNLAQGRYNASKYVPYGEVEKAIPYLLRRAEENSSIEGQVAREYELLVEERKRRML